MDPVDVSVPQTAWTALADRSIVFGHQSVGQNILRGLQDLAVEADVTLVIEERRDAADGPGWRHFRVGSNGDPRSKIEDFAAVLRAGAGTVADVALFKLCYVDFPPAVDPARIASLYIGTLDSLQAEFPGLAVVAVTAPLTTVQSGPKAWIKRLLGRQPGGLAENARRQVFNQAVRARYAAEGRLFDLAALESGGAVQPRDAGPRMEALDPALTEDGGHLNRRGARLIAAALVAFLAETSASPRTN